MLNPADLVAADVIRFIGTTQFEEFTESDWLGYSGCDSPNPMIAYVDGWTVILDGNVVYLTKYNEDSTLHYRIEDLQFILNPC
jgi:hypothetical protein